MDSGKYLSDSEGQDVRKSWLMALYLFIPMSIISAGVVGIEVGEFDVMLFSIAESIFRLWVLYYCAYKKHGRIYLGVFIIINGISYFLHAITGLRDAMSLICTEFNAPSAFVFLFTMIGILISGYFILNCCRLFQLNSTINIKPKNEQGLRVAD